MQSCSLGASGRKFKIQYYRRGPVQLDHFLNEWVMLSGSKAQWVMLSGSKALVACGEIFAARDEVLAWLKTDDPGTNP
jgi:hypothetical protein